MEPYLIKKVISPEDRHIVVKPSEKGTNLGTAYCIIPKEIWNEILTFLCLETLGEVKLVSKSNYNVAVDLWNGRWKIKCSDHFPLSKNICSTMEINWFKLFCSLETLKNKVDNVKDLSLAEISENIKTCFPNHYFLNEKFLNLGQQLFILSNYPQLLGNDSQGMSPEMKNRRGIQCFEEFKKIQKGRNQDLLVKREALKCLKLAVIQDIPEAITALNEYHMMRFSQPLECPLEQECEVQR